MVAFVNKNTTFDYVICPEVTHTSAQWNTYTVQLVGRLYCTTHKKMKGYFLNNIHAKISSCWLAEIMSVNPKQGKNLRKDEISAGSWNWVQKLEIKLIDRKVEKEKLTDGQSNLLFSNQEHALDGTIHGAIFPWLHDTRGLLLLNHLEIFSSISMEKFFHVYY